MATELIRSPSQHLAPQTFDAQLYDDFLAGCSAKTRRAYAGDLALFASFLETGSAALAINKLLSGPSGLRNGTLLRYRNWMVASSLTPATINRRLAAIRSAVRLARTLGLTDWVPEIAGLKVHAYRDTRGPGVPGVKAVLTTARSQESPAKVARDIAMIRLLFDLGLRRSEVVGLDLEDVDQDVGRVWILGKGRSQKEARSCPASTMALIQAWLQIRGTVANASEQAVFVNLVNRGPGHQGRRITGDGLRYVVAKIGDDAGVRTRPHGLRHASITAALDALNGDVRAVQQHARHTSPEVTMRYDDNRKDLAGKVASCLSKVLIDG